VSSAIHLIENAQAFRRGLTDALTRAGFTLVDDPSMAEATIITMRDDTECDAIETHSDSTTVLALLPDPSAAAHAHAMSHGASAATDWNSDPDEIVVVLADAIAGLVRLPISVARLLAAEWPDAHALRPDVEPEEAAWLTDLAAGATVARVADEAGYSERAMFRKLHDLYTRLGVSSRAEAIVAAERFGLLDDE